MTADVAICIPTYNQAQYLAKTIATALEQSEVSCEIWVSDDASGDDTPGVMACFAGHPLVHYHRHPHNLGMVANSTWVVSRPRTEFIVKLDSDDLLAPDYVRTLRECLLRHPRAGYAHAAVCEIDQHGRAGRRRFLSRPPGYQTPEQALRSLVSGLRVAANTCLFRRAAVEPLGFYRTDLVFAEDWDLAVRIADAGWGNVYCERELSCYRVWTDAGMARPRRKLVEVAGCHQMLTETLEPAFRRRGWSTRPIRARRRWLAAGHAGAVASPHFTPVEKAALIGSLRTLGDGPALRWRLWLIGRGWGRLWDLRDAGTLMVKDAVKRLRRLVYRA